MRDQLESAFAKILRELFTSVRGARSASFIDDEGECVDYYGTEDPEQTRLWGAHIQSMLGDLCRGPFPSWRSVRIRTAQVNVEVFPVGEGHLLLLVRDKGSSYLGNKFLLKQTVSALRAEAGFEPNI